MTGTRYTETERLRSYSRVFSRRVFSDIINYDDYSRLDTVLRKYNPEKKRFATYYDCIKYLYRVIAEHYRCEYVYKNEIISKLLIEKYGTKNTVAVNEFRVWNSIADIAMFNGTSKAFEIKTEYDNKKRLGRQMEVYSGLFQERYIVVPEESWRDYAGCVSESVGIVTLAHENGGTKLEEKRKAEAAGHIDPVILMHSVRTAEYRNIVAEYYGELPRVSCFDMFDRCQELVSGIPSGKLQELFLGEMKKRVTSTRLLKSFPKEIRQICLSMNLNRKQSELLKQKLQNKITTNQCIFLTCAASNSN